VIHVGFEMALAVPRNRSPMILALTFTIRERADLTGQTTCEPCVGVTSPPLPRSSAKLGAVASWRRRAYSRSAPTRWGERQRAVQTCGAVGPCRRPVQQLPESTLVYLTSQR